MFHARRRPRHTSVTVLAIVAVLSATFMFALAAVVSPSQALGATSTKVALCPANARNAASLGSSVRRVVSVGTKVTVTGSVAGGSYRVSCAGKTISSSTWYRISAINGKTVSSLYGRTYLYVAKGLFGMAPVTRYAGCGTNLRTAARSSAPAKTAIVTNTKVLVVAKVTGASWSRTCAGVATAGNVWFRISRVNGESVKSRYGVTYLYAPRGVFKTTAGATSVPPPPPPPAKTTGSSVRVTSISALLSALANNSIGDIVVANGTYHVSPASSMRSDSLWIGKRFAGRSTPVTVRAETRGGVTFDGGGTTSYGGMTFIDGAHDQTWDGFNFANMIAGQTGIVVFGGDPTYPPPHHITLRNFTFKSTLRRPTAAGNMSHAVYFAHAKGTGPNNLLVEDLNVQATDSLSLWSAIHAYHGDSVSPPASNVTIRRLTVSGTLNAVVLWYNTGIQRNWLIEGANITGARERAVRFESIGASNIVLKDMVSTGSGLGGFYSSLGSNPPGVTFINTSLR